MEYRPFGKLLLAFGLLVAPGITRTTDARADVKGQGNSSACAELFGGSGQASTCTTYQSAYRSVVGRDLAGPGLKAYVLAWKGPTTYPEMRAQLCTQQTTAPVQAASDGDDSLRALGIGNAYVDVLGRTPTAAERAYWAPKGGCYDELLVANANWLTTASQANRDEVIHRAYKFVFGRDAGDAELAYWRGGFGKITRGACGQGNVRGYADLVCVNTEWAAASAGAEELKATIARALVASGVTLDPTLVGKWSARYAADKSRYRAGGFPQLSADVKSPLIDPPKGVPGPVGRPQR